MAIATFDLSRFLGQAALALNRPEIGGKKVQNKRNGLCHYGRKWKMENGKPYVDSPLPVSGPEQRGVDGRRRACFSADFSEIGVRGETHPPQLMC